MALVYDAVKNWAFPDVEQTYSEKDTIIYALSVGMGSDPVDERQLTFVHEGRLQTLPTMAPILGAASQAWMRDPRTGIDFSRIIHGETLLTVHQPLAPAATIIGRTRVEEIIDKGQDRGALIYWRRDISDKKTGSLLSTVRGTLFCRGNGGFGGPSGPLRPVHPLPDRAPDHVVELKTVPQQALLFRLNGDLHPLHIDPETARKSGFERPILHGPGTFGFSGHALLRELCNYNPVLLKRMDARFSAPVLPGDTIVTEIWREGRGTGSFRCRVAERDGTVVNNGYVEFDE